MLSLSLHLPFFVAPTSPSAKVMSGLGSSTFIAPGIDYWLFEAYNVRYNTVTMYLVDAVALQVQSEPGHARQKFEKKIGPLPRAPESDVPESLNNVFGGIFLSSLQFQFIDEFDVLIHSQKEHPSGTEVVGIPPFSHSSVTC